MAHNTNSLRLLDKTNLGIASGAITPSQLYHQITSETGTADDLATINISGFVQLADGSNTYRPMVVLYAAATHTVTIKHGTGNISLNGATDFALSGEKQLLLFYNGSNWTDISVASTASGDMLAATYDPATISEQLVGLTATQTLTNKTMDFASNTFQNVGEGVLAKVGSPTYTTIQHMQNTFHSSGHISGGVLSDAGAGNLDVSAGTGYIRATDSKVAELLFFDWSASLTNAIPINTTRHVGVQYNAGSPQIVVSVSEAWDYNTDFVLGSVVNEGGTLHISDHPHSVGDHANPMIQRIHDIMGIERAHHDGGLIISETGTRNLALSTGYLWDKFDKRTISALDTSVADTFDYYYRDGASGFTKVAAQTAWNNTQYDNDSGTLATLANSKWGVHWVYLETDGDLVVLYGQAEYASLSEAEVAVTPPSTPDRTTESGILIAKIVFQKNDTSANQIDSVFVTVFVGSGASDHGSLAGLADDDHTQYTLISSGTVAPTSTPSRVGLLYVDTVANTWYISTGTTSSSDWTIRSAGGAGGGTSKARITDEKTTGTDGGSSSAATYNARDLNTIQDDDDSIVTSVTSNEFVVVSGTYDLDAMAPALSVVGGHRMRLYNVTAVSVVQEGGNNANGSGSSDSSIANLKCRFTSNGTDSYRIDHYTVAANAGDGLGKAVSDGSPEIYLVIELEKQL